MEKLLAESAEVFDMDDTLVSRTVIHRAVSNLKTRNPLRRPYPYTRLEQLPEVNHRRVEGVITGKVERWQFKDHMKRTAIATTRDLLIQSAQSGNDIYILTGRSTDSEWYDGTEEQLEREGILPYVSEPDKRLHTPGGRHTALSKVHGLFVLSQLYKTTRMNEDDWSTTELGARLLRERGVSFRYIYHGFPSYYPTDEQLRANPNISVLDLSKTR